MFKYGKILILFLVTVIINSCATQTHSINKVITAKKSFVKVNVYIQPCLMDGECGEYVNYAGGSGSIINIKGNLYALTAAHICDPNLSSFNPGQTANVKLWIIDREGKRHEASVIKSNRSLDVCVLDIGELKLPALKLAAKKPAYSEKVFNIAAPLGISDKEMVPILEGRYSGDSEGWAYFALPAAPGASGSPILNQNAEIVGIVLAVHRNFHHVTLSVQHTDLWNYLISL